MSQTRPIDLAMYEASLHQQPDQVGFQQTDDVFGEACIVLVNGRCVTQREMVREMRRERTGVIKEIRARKGRLTNVDKDFWESEQGGLVPFDILKEKALENMVGIKIKEEMMLEYGIMVEKTYMEFLDTLDSVNEWRLASSGNGTVIYGPVEYTETGYFDYLFTNRLITLQEAMVGKTIKVTQTNLEKHFETIKESIYGSGYGKVEDHLNFVRTHYIEHQFELIFERRKKSSSVKIDEDGWSQLSVSILSPP
ncbi:hypothetical protein ACFSKL_07580 [Belliella marina]|uniref:Uncharacterized protein n=1 Tax=Belliella marina TaxID=1644146 RepID=A0ABW4VJY5_9BACT